MPIQGKQSKQLVAQCVRLLNGFYNTVELGSTDIARDRENYVGCGEVDIKERNNPGDRKMHVCCSEMSVEPRSVEPSSTVDLIATAVASQMALKSAHVTIALYLYVKFVYGSSGFTIATEITFSLYKLQTAFIRISFLSKSFEIKISQNLAG